MTKKSRRQAKEILAIGSVIIMILLLGCYSYYMIGVFYDPFNYMIVIGSIALFGVLIVSGTLFAFLFVLEMVEYIGRRKSRIKETMRKDRIVAMALLERSKHDPLDDLIQKPKNVDIPDELFGKTVEGDYDAD